VKGKAGGGGAAHHEPHTAEQRARSKWSSRREKTDRRMSSFSDCAVDPEPVATGRRLDLTAAAAPPVSSIPLLRPSPPLWPGFRAGRVTALPTARLSPRPRAPHVTEQTVSRLPDLAAARRRPSERAMQLGGLDVLARDRERRRRQWRG